MIDTSTFKLQGKGNQLDNNTSRAALGHSTDLRWNTFQLKGNTWKPEIPGTQTGQDIGIGFNKGVVSTVMGAADLGKKMLGPVANIFPNHGDTGAPGAKLRANSTPDNAAQTAGFGAEKVGEFFAPAGAEKAVYEKAAGYIDKLPEAVGATSKIGQFLVNTLKNALKVGTRGAITGASTAGVTALQTGGDLKQTTTAGIAGGVSGALGEALTTFGKPFAEAMQKADFKLSPQAEAKAAKKVDSAARFMTENKILGSDESKFNKLGSLTNNMESALQASLPQDFGVSKQSIIDNITSRVEKLKTDDPAIYNSAKRDATEAIDLLKSNQEGYVSFENTLNGKRSYGQQAFKTSQYAVKDPRVVSEGSYAIEQGYQEALENSLNKVGQKINLPSNLQPYFGGKTEVTLPEFNKVYSQAITSKNLTGMSRFKKDSGLLGRFFGLWVGETIGQAVMPGLGGKIAGATIGELGATRLPSLVRRAAERMIASGGIVPTATKVGLGVSQSTPTGVPTDNNDGNNTDDNGN